MKDENKLEENENVETAKTPEEENETDKEIEKLQKEKKKKKKGKIGRMIGNLIFTLLFLVILFEAIVGIVNMKKLNDGEEPVWYLSTSKTEEPNKVVTEYDLGLYRIVKTDTDKDSRIVLKPFFIGN